MSSLCPGPDRSRLSPYPCLVKVLLLENIHPLAVENLERAGYDVELRSAAMSEDELVAGLGGVAMLGIRSNTHITQRVLDNAPDLRPLIAEGRKVVCLRTFSKIYGLASLRVGYGYADAGIVALLNRVRQPFNVNAIAQVAAVAALDDDTFAATCARQNRAGLAQLEAGFDERGLEWVPSVANFILVRVGDGAAVFAALQQRGVIVRPMRSYGMPEWVRITVGTREQNERLLVELSAVLGVLRKAAQA